MWQTGGSLCSTSYNAWFSRERSHRQTHTYWDSQLYNQTKKVLQYSKITLLQLITFIHFLHISNECINSELDYYCFQVYWAFNLGYLDQGQELYRLVGISCRGENLWSYQTVTTKICGLQEKWGPVILPLFHPSTNNPLPSSFSVLTA